MNCILQVGFKVLLLLLGATIASCHFLKNVVSGLGLHHAPMVYPSPGRLPQFMTHLLPSGGNIIYKPQFIIPPVIEGLMKTKIDCERHGSEHYLPILPEMVVQKPLKPVIVPREPEVVIEQKPIQIPEPPVLPPFTMPEIPIFVEEPRTSAPITEPIVIKENCKPLEIPASPVLPRMPELPIPDSVISGFEPLLAPEYIPVEIPEAPILPPLSLPELPLPIPEYKPAVIAEAPILPPMPTIHVSDIPAGPTLPPFVLPKFPEIVIEEKHPEINEIPFVPYEVPQIIPQPPVLPPIPEAPTLPLPSFVEVSAPAPCIYNVPEIVPNDIDIPKFQPVEIPEPPVLPPFTMPELPPLELHVNDKPIVVNIIPPSPVLPPLELPAPLPNIVQVPQVFERNEIPMLPETPPVIVQHPSVTEVIPEPCVNNGRVPENKPILILEQHHPITGVTTQEVVPELMELNVGGEKVTIPSLSSLSFPNFCVQNLIIDRALPSMIIGEKYYANSLGPYAATQNSMLPMFQYYKR